MSKLVYFGDLHYDNQGGQYFDYDGEYVPLNLVMRRKGLAYRDYKGRFHDASSLRYEEDLSRNRKALIGDEDLFFRIYSDFQEAKAMRGEQKRSERLVIYGDLYRDRFGNYTYKCGDEYVKIAILLQGNRRYLRLQSGEMIDASSIRFEADYTRNATIVIGRESVYHQLYQDHMEAKNARMRYGKRVEVQYGVYEMLDGTPYLSIGDVKIRLHTFVGKDGNLFVMLNSGIVRSMEETRLVKNHYGQWCMYGPENLLADLLSDFADVTKKADGQARNPTQNHVGSFQRVVDNAEYWVVDTAKRVRNYLRGAVVAGIIALTTAFVAFGPKIDSAPNISTETSHKEHVRTEQVQDNAWNSGYGSVFNSKKMFEDNFSASGKSETTLNSKETRSRPEQNPGGTVSVSMDEKIDTLDMSMKENLDIARKQGFWGIAKKINPRMSVLETDKLAKKIAKENLKPGHKNINLWQLNNLKNQGRIIVKQNLTRNMTRIL